MDTLDEEMIVYTSDVLQEMSYFLSPASRMLKSSRDLPIVEGPPAELAVLESVGYLNVKSLTIPRATLEKERIKNANTPDIPVSVKGGAPPATLGFLKTYTKAMFGKTLKGRTNYVIFLLQPDNLRAIEENNHLIQKRADKAK